MPEIEDVKRGEELELEGEGKDEFSAEEVLRRELRKERQRRQEDNALTDNIIETYRKTRKSMKKMLCLGIVLAAFAFAGYQLLQTPHDYSQRKQRDYITPTEAPRFYFYCYYKKIGRIISGPHEFSSALFLQQGDKVVTDQLQFIFMPRRHMDLQIRLRAWRLHKYKENVTKRVKQEDGYVNKTVEVTRTERRYVWNKTERRKLQGTTNTTVSLQHNEEALTNVTMYLGERVKIRFRHISHKDARTIQDLQYTYIHQVRQRGAVFGISMAILGIMLGVGLAMMTVSPPRRVMRGIGYTVFSTLVSFGLIHFAYYSRGVTSVLIYGSYALSFFPLGLFLGGSKVREVASLRTFKDRKCWVFKLKLVDQFGDDYKPMTFTGWLVNHPLEIKLLNELENIREISGNMGKFKHYMRHHDLIEAIHFSKDVKIIRSRKIVLPTDPAGKPIADWNSKIVQVADQDKLITELERINAALNGKLEMKSWEKGRERAQIIATVFDALLKMDPQQLQGVKRTLKEKIGEDVGTREEYEEG